MTSVVYCRTFLNLMSSLFSNLKKKTNSENISTPKVGVLNIEFALKLRIYRSLKRLICLKWIRKKLSTTLYTQFNYLTYSLSLPLKSVKHRIFMILILPNIQFKRRKKLRCCKQIKVWWHCVCIFSNFSYAVLELHCR